MNSNIKIDVAPEKKCIEKDRRMTPKNKRERERDQSIKYYPTNQVCQINAYRTGSAAQAKCLKL